MNRSHPLASMFDQEDETPPTHKLAPEAQAENLRAAWAYYSSPKTFTPGQLLRGRVGLGVYKKDPVLLYVRPLDLSHEFDRLLVQDSVERLSWAKVDCICAQATDDAGVVFLPCDSDLLEPYP
jgi:hypothetical protein